jgi:histidinol-phosphatase
LVTPSPFLETALDAARRAGEIILRYYHGEFEVEFKADQTPVTVADREAEEVIRSVLLGRFPEHGFTGEETGASAVDTEFRWLVDPLDGTKSFVRGYPFFSTQIALMQGDELVLGVSLAPAFNETAWAEQGQGAWLNGEPVHVSEVARIEDATVSLGNIGTLAKDPPRWTALGKLLARANRTRGFGDFYHYHLLAAGRIDAVIESDVNILDVAALAVIVREAGGVFTDLRGQPAGRSIRSVLAASPALYGPIFEALQGLPA